MSSDPTLIRGDDGALYYLPPGELDSYRLPDDQAAEVTSKLEDLASQADDEVSGFAFDAFTPQQLSPRALGLNPSATMIGDNDKTRTGFPGNTLRDITSGF